MKIFFIHKFASLARIIRIVTAYKVKLTPKTSRDQWKKNIKFSTVRQY